MLKRFCELRDRQVKDAFGVGAKRALSIYSIFALAMVVLPIAMLIFALVVKALK